MRSWLPVVVLVALALAAASQTGAKPPGAEQILRKAEEVRNPDRAYAVDFTIHGVARGTPATQRDASYSMIAGGKDRTVLLMRSPEWLYGTVLLMAEDRYWMLLPKASKAWELSAAQMMNGDMATGDIARANLTRGYAVVLSGEEAIDGEPCWRLELESTGNASHYPRIDYWVAKKGFLPRKLDHFGRTGKLLKSVRYGDYRKGALGLRPMRMTVQSLDEWKEDSTLTFKGLRTLDAKHVSFAPEGMIPFRDAALASRITPEAIDVPLERILRAAEASRPSEPGR